MKYEDISALSKDEIEAAIVRDDPEELLNAVVSAALYSDDPAWAEDVCVRMSSHEHFNVRGNAMLGFGHIARIHTKLTERKVKPLIEAAFKDKSDYVRGHANAAADDVEYFLKWELNRQK